MSKLTPAQAAQAYYRLFNTEDGKIVLGDMERRMPLSGSRFRGKPPYCPLDAAMREGECNTLREIKLTIEAGKESLKPKTPK